MRKLKLNLNPSSFQCLNRKLFFFSSIIIRVYVVNEMGQIHILQAWERQGDIYIIYMNTCPGWRLSSNANIHKHVEWLPVVSYNNFFSFSFFVLANYTETPTFPISCITFYTFFFVLPLFIKILYIGIRNNCQLFIPYSHNTVNNGHKNLCSFFFMKIGIIEIWHI